MTNTLLAVETVNGVKVMKIKELWDVPMNMVDEAGSNWTGNFKLECVTYIQQSNGQPLSSIGDLSGYATISIPEGELRLTTSGKVSMNLIESHLSTPMKAVKAVAKSVTPGKGFADK